MALRNLLSDDPTTLGPYELRGRLGVGGMGVVYLGFDAAGEAVAVKTLPPDADPDARAGMRLEALLMASIRSPRVARFVAADTEADLPWLAIAYISGPSLAEVPVPLAEGPLHQLGLGLADALAALDAAGIVHRDLKPGNVLLGFDGPVLVDFGIAQAGIMAVGPVAAANRTGTTLGSPRWMSPEQIRGGLLTSATDVWGWAAIMAYAATGRPPFGGGAVAGIASRILTEKPDLDGTPDWLRPALAAGLVKSPADRPDVPDLPALLGSAVHGGRHSTPGARLADDSTRADAVVRVPDAVDATQALPIASSRSARRHLLPVAAAVAILLGVGGIAVATKDSAPPARPAAIVPTSTPAAPTPAISEPATTEPAFDEPAVETPQPVFTESRRDRRDRERAERKQAREAEKDRERALKRLNDLLDRN